MTSLQIVAVGVRLFSIWVVLNLLGHSPGLWSYVSLARSGGTVAGMAVAVSLVVILFAAGLWFFPLAVARKLLPPDTQDQSTPMPAERFEQAGFCLLGLWVLTKAIPDLVYHAVAYATLERDDPIFFDQRTYPIVAHCVAEFIVGVWLLFGARELLGVLRWARTAGVTEPSNSAGETDGPL